MVVWLVVRVVFFVGFAGSDDLYYHRYAVLWDRTPVNNWEARLVGNGLTAFSMMIFGRKEVAAVLPSLAASLVMLTCVLYWCHKYGTIRHALWGGLLLAVLPLDVEMATTISPHTLMAAMVGAGTLAFLHQPADRFSRTLAAVLLALGVVTHFAGIYYVAALALAALCIAPRRYAAAALLILIAGLVVIGLDMAVFHFAFDDATGRFRVCMAEVNTHKTGLLLKSDGRFNPDFVLWPIVNLGYSKALGLSLVVVLIVGLVNYRRLDERLRIMVVVIAAQWVWMSFGSQVPWDYRPFLRMSRFLQPLTVSVGILFAVTIASSRRRRLAGALGTLALAACVFNLSVAGSWGQNVAISRELLAYARSRPPKRHVTDYHTYNEMYALVGAKTLSNVVTIDHTPRSRLLDRDAEVISTVQLTPDDQILCNPLNVSRTPEFESFLARHSGAPLYQSPPAYRHLCRLIPPLRSHPRAVRKPPARVLAVASDRQPEPHTCSISVKPGG